MMQCLLQEAINPFYPISLNIFMNKVLFCNTKSVSKHLVVNGNERVVRGKGSGRSLAMYKQSFLSSINHMLLHLGNVVRNIINDVHV